MGGRRGVFVSILMILVFVCPCLLGIVTAATPEDIVIDGDLNDWSADSMIGTDSNGVTLHLTWNQTHLSLGWDGTDLSSTEGADIFVYLNTSEGGSSLSPRYKRGPG